MKHLVYILFLFAAVACSTTPSSSGLKTITLREVQSKPAAEVLQQEELNASVKMIPLETTDSCLLGAVEQLVDADYLWVVSNSQIYQFDHTDFNDTVYAFDGTKLTPHYLLDIGSYKYSYAEQEVVGDYATKDPIEGVRIQVSNFFETADYLFISYTVHTHSNQQGKEKDTRLALYDKQNETMHPDISIRCADHAYLSLKGNEPVFASVDEHSLYISKYPADLLEEHDIPDLDAEGNPVLIRYTFDE